MDPAIRACASGGIRRVPRGCGPCGARAKGKIIILFISSEHLPRFGGVAGWIRWIRHPDAGSGPSGTWWRPRRALRTTRSALPAIVRMYLHRKLCGGTSACGCGAGLVAGSGRSGPGPVLPSPPGGAALRVCLAARHQYDLHMRTKPARTHGFGSAGAAWEKQ